LGENLGRIDLEVRLVNVVFSIVLLAFFIVTVGKLCGRFLGIKLGRWRGILVGAIGWLGGVIGAAVVVGIDTPNGREIEIDTVWGWIGLGALVIIFGVIAAMPVAIGLDLLTRSAAPRTRRRRRAWLHPIRTTKQRLAPYGRMREVVANARRVNLLHLRYASRSALESPEMSRRLRLVLEDSGGMMVKLGQIASTRSDALPEALTTELASLRADVRAEDPALVREVLETELGETTEQAFQSFEWEPLAAASIGQTHRAVLHDGTPVVVKVQRPGIADVVGRDAAVLRLAARQLDRRVEAARTLGLRALVEELISGLEQELDYQHEGSVGTQLRERRAADVGIAIPKVYPTLTTGRVLVMEQVVARSVADEAALEASPVPRPELASRLLTSFLGQVLQDGLFHADPHPGNLLIDDAGTIWLLDFGSVGRLDSRALDGLRGMALGVATGDPGMVARAARDMSGDEVLVDLRSLENDIGAQLAQLDGGRGIDPRLITAVLRVMDRHGMRAPASITLLARALITLEGTLKMLSPGFDFGRASVALVGAEGQEMFGTPQEMLQREVLRAMPSLRTLPDHAETLANQLRAGRMTVRTEHYSGPDGVIVDAWVDRFVLTIIGGAGAVASAVLLFAAAATDNDKVRVTLWILGFAGMGFATILLMRAAARALRRHPGRID
jgi:ubiquinone biosynthesis protein